MYLKKRIRPSKQIGNKAQSSLEIATAIIAAVFLLWGSFALFLWLNQSLVLRQEGYERSRVEAGTAIFPYPVPEPRPLKIEW